MFGRVCEICCPRTGPYEASHILILPSTPSFLQQNDECRWQSEKKLSAPVSRCWSSEGFATRQRIEARGHCKALARAIKSQPSGAGSKPKSANHCICKCKQAPQSSPSRKWVKRPTRAHACSEVTALMLHPELFSCAVFCLGCHGICHLAM